MPAKKISIPLLFGLIAALCSILFACGAWLAGPAAFIGPTVWLDRCLAILIAAIAAALEKRVRGGALDFRSALKISYGILVLAIAAQSLMEWLIPSVIDPHFYQQIVPVLIAKTEKSYLQFGAADDQLRAAVNDIRANNQFSLGRVISGTGYLLVLFFIIAVLIAVTVKSKTGPTPKPESQNT
jgi:hypothetical protein